MDRPRPDPWHWETFGERHMLGSPDSEFVNLVEVVPPAGPDPGPVLDALSALAGLPIAAFTVASNPVAKPRMSALAVCALIIQRTGVPAIVHCTTRDHNRLGVWSLLCGARALGIQTALITTGDYVALGDRGSTTTVGDLDVFALVGMARSVGLQTGVVFDPHPETGGLDAQVERLVEKADAGAEFVVTQPLFDEEGVARLASRLAVAGIPAILGVLPLRSARHADFLHHRVSGISVPEAVRRRMLSAENPIAEGLSTACDLLAAARRHFAGACLMPPFGHYEVVAQMLESGGTSA